MELGRTVEQTQSVLEVVVLSIIELNQAVVCQTKCTSNDPLQSCLHRVVSCDSQICHHIQDGICNLVVYVNDATVYSIGKTSDIQVLWMDSTYAEWQSLGLEIKSAGLKQSSYGIE